MYTIKQAAVRSGVSVAVLRAWERRYGIVRPERTASGYRLYDDAAIDRLRAMRVLIESGWSASQAAREIETAGIPAAAAQTRSHDGLASAVDATRAFVDAAAVLDEARLDAVIDDIFARGSFERAIDDRVMPALRALGDAWAEGTVSVAAEHAASHAVLRRIATAFEAASRSGIDPPVLVGLPPGSRHEIGALAFATAARRRGIGVVYLGADVPIPSWTDAITATHARAVVVGISTREDLAPALAVIDSVASAPSLLVAVGGAAASDAELPGGVLRLPGRIADAATALADALSDAAGRPRHAG